MKQVLYLTRNGLLEPLGQSQIFPQGEGWSPMTWRILEGASRIPITPWEATAEFDAGLLPLARSALRAAGAACAAVASSVRLS